MGEEYEYKLHFIVVLLTLKERKKKRGWGGNDIMATDQVKKI